MIRLSRFFKRNPETEEFDKASELGRRSSKRIAPRSFQRAQENEALAFTEDPERQRARHRLIGAAVLVLIAVIALPRILDSKPKLNSNDIAVNIVTSLPVISAAPEDTLIPALLDSAVKGKQSSASKEPGASMPSPETKPAPAQSKSSSIGLIAGEEVVPASNLKAKSEEPVKKSSATGKFVIQIGTFASEERAKGWIAKMKAQSIPNYVLNKTGADGVKLYVLRAGPFADKDAAEAAEKKVKEMGLSPRLVEVGAP
jgi:DedD protein